MIEIIISSPHAKTKYQRLTSLILYVIGWVLWGYFLFPLLALGCSFLDVYQCSQWVRISGNFQSLQETLINYLKIVAAIAFVWVAWLGYGFIPIHSRPKQMARGPVSCEDLSQMFNVPKESLKECQESGFVVVHFDNNGSIIGLEKD